jgi:VWFA-related protein
LMTAGTEQLLMRLRPGDLARVATFGGSQRTTMSDTFSDDFASLSNALRRKTGTCGNTPLWPALYSVMEAFEPIRGDERAVVLVFSDGADSGGNIRDVDVIDRARSGAVMIYSIAMQGIDYATSTNSFRALTTVAAESGGGFTDLPARKDISAAFARVADELHAQYLIGFEPPKRDGREHRIDVRSLRRGLKVRARKSYLAPMP